MLGLKIIYLVVLVINILVISSAFLMVMYNRKIRKHFINETRKQKPNSYWYKVGTPLYFLYVEEAWDKEYLLKSEEKKHTYKFRMKMLLAMVGILLLTPFWPIIWVINMVKKAIKFISKIIKK